jgi:hypothetical protein
MIDVQYDRTMFRWLDDNIETHQYDVTNIVVIDNTYYTEFNFKNEQDAIMFKLKFG